MWRLILGTMGVKSLVQGLNAAATAGFEPRTVWSEVRRRNRLATALLSALSQFPCLLFVQIRPFLDSIHICPERIQAKSVCFLQMESLDWPGPIAVSEYTLSFFSDRASLVAEIFIIFLLCLLNIGFVWHQSQQRETEMLVKLQDTLKWMKSMLCRKAPACALLFCFFDPCLCLIDYKELWEGWQHPGC